MRRLTPLYNRGSRPGLYDFAPVRGLQKQTGLDATHSGAHACPGAHAPGFTIRPASGAPKTNATQRLSWGSRPRLYDRHRFGVETCTRQSWGSRPRLYDATTSRSKNKCDSRLLLGLTPQAIRCRRFAVGTGLCALGHTLALYDVAPVWGAQSFGAGAAVLNAAETPPSSARRERDERVSTLGNCNVAIGQKRPLRLAKGRERDVVRALVPSLGRDRFVVLADGVEQAIEGDPALVVGAALHVEPSARPRLSIAAPRVLAGPVVDIEESTRQRTRRLVENVPLTGSRSHQDVLGLPSCSPCGSDQCPSGPGLSSPRCQVSESR